MSNTLKEKVEQRLQDKQKSKEFKDLGRVSNSRKEQAAYKIISSQNLADLETDGVMAFNLVEKDRVWTYEIDPETEKANGVSSGAAFLKTKLKEAMGKRPGDKVIQRRIYVAYLEELQVKLEAAKTVEDICLMRPYFLDSWQSLDAQQNKVNNFCHNFAEQLHEKSFEVQNLDKSYDYYDIKREYEDCFGKRFLNLFDRKVDTAKEIWHDAEQKEAYSAEKEAEYVERVRESQRANAAKLYEYFKASKMSDADFKAYMQTKILWNSSLTVNDYRNACRHWFEGAESDLVKPVTVPEGNKQREEDWAWADIKKTRTPSVSGESTGIEINTKPPLDHIIRTGGLRIGIVSPESVASLFGFGAVNFGNYVKDNEAREHLRHFLGAMADLGEILNFDLAAMNRLGNLKIGFGLKGKGKALATYHPQTKDINLTKKRGDGSIAHEWGHYLDNMLGEYALMRGTSVFATNAQAKNPRVNNAVQRLMNYIKKGGDGEMKMTFKAIDSGYSDYFSVPFVYQYNGYTRTYRESFNVNRNGNENLGDTIKKYLAKISRYNEDNYSIRNLFDVLKKVFGQVAFMFNLPEIEVTTKLNMTRFYYNSSQVGSKYWIENVELFARAWESYVQQKLVSAGRKNNYLVNIPNYTTMPYPEGDELTRIVELFDELIDLVKREHSIGDFVPFTDEREDFIENGAMVETSESETNVETVVEVTPSVIYDPIYQWGDMVRVTNWKNPVKVEEFNVTKAKTYFLGRYNGTRYNMSVANIEGFITMPLRFFKAALEIELAA